MAENVIQQAAFVPLLCACIWFKQLCRWSESVLGICKKDACVEWVLYASGSLLVALVVICACSRNSSWRRNDARDTQHLVGNTGGIWSGGTLVAARPALHHWFWGRPSSPSNDACIYPFVHSHSQRL